MPFASINPTNPRTNLFCYKRVRYRTTRRAILVKKINVCEYFRFPQVYFLLNTFESLLCQLHYSTNKVTSASKVFSVPCQLPRLSRSHIVNTRKVLTFAETTIHLLC